MDRQLAVVGVMLLCGTPAASQTLSDHHRSVLDQAAWEPLGTGPCIIQWAEVFHDRDAGADELYVDEMYTYVAVSESTWRLQNWSAAAGDPGPSLDLDVGRDRDVSWSKERDVLTLDAYPPLSKWVGTARATALFSLQTFWACGAQLTAADPSRVVRSAEARRFVWASKMFGDVAISWNEVDGVIRIESVSVASSGESFVGREWRMRDGRWQAARVEVFRDERLRRECVLEKAEAMDLGDAKRWCAVPRIGVDDHAPGTLPTALERDNRGANTIRYASGVSRYVLANDSATQSVSVLSVVGRSILGGLVALLSGWFLLGRRKRRRAGGGAVRGP